MPCALWGSELWGEGFASCKVLEATLAVGLRMIAGAPPRTSRVALGWELGYIPVHLRAAARRLRILEKWRVIDPQKEPSGLWQSRIFRLPEKGRHWSWTRKTAVMAVNSLNVVATAKALRLPGKSFSFDMKLLLAAATLVYYRKWARSGSSKINNLLDLIHDAEVQPTLAPYLRLRGPRGRVLLMIRTGSLLLNDRVSSYSSVRPSTCQSCISRTNVYKEDLEHFLLDCPKYSDIRAEWSLQWDTPVGVLFSQRRPASLSVALGESAQFFADLRPPVAKAMQVARMDALQAMWSLRCAVLAPHFPPTKPPPRVNAD